MSDIPEDILPRSPQTPLPVPAEVSSVRSVVHPVKKREVGRFLSTGQSEDREQRIETHDETATLVVDILLQRGLTNMRDTRDGWFAVTYLILHHCVTNVFNHAAKFIHVLNVVEKTFNLPLFGQEG